MGPGVAFLLIGLLAPMGGVADDVAPVDVQASIQMDGAVAASMEEASVAADAQALEASASTDVAEVQADQERIAVATGDVSSQLPLDVPLLDAVNDRNLQVTTAQEPTTPPTGSQAPATESAGPALAPEAPDIELGALLAQAGPAAALAAIAVFHAEPPGLWVRRFAPLLGLYTRIPRSQVLDHETREAIYELLLEDPGLSLGEITEELDLSRSTARHHVKKLEEAEMIASATEGRCRIHFPVGRKEEAVAQHLLNHPQRATIAELLAKRPLSLVDLSHVLDANPGAVHFHLKKLREAGLVERHENGSVVYRRA